MHGFLLMVNARFHSICNRFEVINIFRLACDGGQMISAAIGSAIHDYKYYHLSLCQPRFFTSGSLTVLTVVICLLPVKTYTGLIMLTLHLAGIFPWEVFCRIRPINNSFSKKFFLHHIFLADIHILTLCTL